MTGLTTFVAMGWADPSADITAKQSQEQSIQSQIATLNSQLEAKVESYNYANVQLGQINKNIDANKAKLDDATAKLATAQDRLQKRVVDIYRDGDVGVLDVLMQTSNLDDFLTKYDMLSKLGEQDRNDLAQIKELKSQIETTQKQLQGQQSQQAGLVSQLGSEKTDIQASIGQQQSMLAGVQNDIASLQQQQQAQQQQEQQAFQASMSGNAGGQASYGGGGGGGGTPPPATAGGAVAIAEQYLGVPYVWAGASPSGFDCSGLVMYVYAQLGISLPHSAAAQYSAGTPISYNELQPGDLVFFGYSGIEHVGIYVGGGQMIDAPYPGQVVRVEPVSDGGSYRGACRL